MRKLLLVAAVLLLVPATAWAVASDAELEAVLAELEADEARCEAAREEADAITRANTRPLFRDLLIPITEAGTLAEARELAEYALEVLAAPGGGASKVIHTANRQMGATCLQGIRGAGAELEALLG